MPDAPGPDGSPQPAPSGLPPGVPPPPPPKPHILNTGGPDPTYGGKAEGGRKRGRKAKKPNKGPSHPTDLLHAPPPRTGRRGCCGCLLATVALLALLAVALAAVVAWASPLRYATKEGYRIVNLDDTEAVVTEAPDEPTLYLGRVILYEATQTRVPVAFIGTEVVLDGDYWEDVSATATRVVGSPGARFAKDLEILALEFEDGGVELRGELSGRVMKNVP